MSEDKVKSSGLMAFWSTMPGVITAITGLIAAVGSIFIGVKQLNPASAEKPSTQPVPASEGQVPIVLVLPPAEPVPDEEVNSTEATDEELEMLATECEEGFMESCDELFDVSPVDSGFEDYGGTCGGRLADKESEGECQEHALLATQCEEGFMESCDELFEVSPVDSEFEEYGGTCGGRLDDMESEGQCQDLDWSDSN